MATDRTDPRVGLIVRIGVLSIGMLLLIHAALVSYFDRMARAETYRKVGSLKPEALLSMRADERQRLASGPMPIEKSMQTMAAKGRMGMAPELAPSASKDVGPLQGWSQMPSEVPPTMLAPDPSSAAPASPSAAPSASSAPSAGVAPGAPPHNGSNPPRHP
jgi:hypothetical protein